MGPLCRRWLLSLGLCGLTFLGAWGPLPAAQAIGKASYSLDTLLRTASWPQLILAPPPSSEAVGALLKQARVNSTSLPPLPGESLRLAFEHLDWRGELGFVGDRLQQVHYTSPVIVAGADLMALLQRFQRRYGQPQTRSGGAVGENWREENWRWLLPEGQLSVTIRRFEAEGTWQISERWVLGTVPTPPPSATPVPAALSGAETAPPLPQTPADSASDAGPDRGPAPRENPVK